MDQETAEKGDMETMNPRVFIGSLHQLTPTSETLYSLPGGYFTVPGNCTRGSRSKKAPRVDLYVFGACRERGVSSCTPNIHHITPTYAAGNSRQSPAFDLQERLDSPGAV
jgi:hypothetical protein